MPIAFVSPFENKTNQYIELHKKILSQCFYDVKPLNVKTIFSKNIFDLFNKNSILIFHWLETRPFKWTDSTPRFHLVGFLMFLFYVLVIVFSSAKSIYFVHDHAVHDTVKFNRKFSIFLIKLLLKISDIRIVHDPMHTEIYKAIYLPIPLYDDVKTLSREKSQNHYNEKDFVYGILGAIRPYKAIHEILENWPNNHNLVIRGKALKSYDALLKNIIRSNQQQQYIDYKEGFLNEIDFESMLQSIDVFILPHSAGSMLVSGAFFEVVGRVRYIIARRTPFLEWVQNEFKGIYLFDKSSEINNIINKIETSAEDIDFIIENKTKAIKLFGFENCKTTYNQFLKSL